MSYLSHLRKSWWLLIVLPIILLILLFVTKWSFFAHYCRCRFEDLSLLLQLNILRKILKIIHCLKFQINLFTLRILPRYLLRRLRPIQFQLRFQMNKLHLFLILLIILQCIQYLSIFQKHLLCLLVLLAVFLIEITFLIWVYPVFV